MRNLLTFILTILLTLTACNNKKSKYSQPLTAKTDSINLIDKANEFLDLFKTINPNGLHIYPPSWDIHGKIDNTPFEGNPIDVDKFSYVNNEEFSRSLPSCKKGLSHIHAVGKFEINRLYIGLIIRQLSEYDDSLIQLFLWNKKQNKIEKGIDLADSYAGIGYYSNTESWIVEYEKNRTLKVVTRIKDCNFENSKHKIYTDSLKTNVFSGGKFTETLNEINDSVNFRLKEWK